MRTIEKTVYKLDELPEETQEKIIQQWRQDDEYLWSYENQDSLYGFAELFSITITDYEYGHHNYIDWKYNYEPDYMDYVDTLEPLRLRTYIINNYYDSICTKKYLKHVNGKPMYSKVQKEISCPFTGYFMDDALLEPIIDFIANPIKNNYDNLADLINDCLHNWIKACEADYEDWLSEEAVRNEIEANDHEFYSDGTLT